MEFWIGCVLALFVVQTLIAPSIQYLGDGARRGENIAKALGPRDDPPVMPPVARRAGRALDNMFEALPVFLTLALLCLIKGHDSELARTGAMTFFLARLAYVPSYMVGIMGLRSAVWGVGWIGLGMMIWALSHS